MADSSSETVDFFKVRNSPFPALDSPSRTFERDVANLVRNSRLLFSILRPFHTDESLDELYMHRPTIGSLIYLVFTSMLFMIFTLSTFLFAFVASQVVRVVGRGYTCVFWYRVQGKTFHVYPETLKNPHDLFDPCQRWVFINGIATTKTLMAQECQYLFQKFHNPILGINNRTYGFIGDIMECVIQRSFNYHTSETRLAFQVIKSYLVEDVSVINKVVLLAHSQGGIIASHVLDSLLLDSDVSPTHLAKLEIYTFGSAALTMNNPFTDASRSKRMIGVIEHYCNEHDMVASWGALSSSVAGNRRAAADYGQSHTSDAPPSHDQADNKATGRKAKNSISYPFMGKVLIRYNQTGHLLDQHYLRPMFGVDSIPNSNLHTQANQKPSLSYLDCVVEKIEECTNHGLDGVSLLDNDARYEVLPRQADSSKGERRLRDVSRLWSYLGI